jgi:RNA polymerase sigma factor (sigma-70 family)
LSELERTMFDGYFVERLTIRELAERLDIPKSTVWRQRNRIIEKLRTELEDNPTVKAHLQ